MTATKTLLTCPEAFDLYGCDVVMSNFDHRINPEVAKVLKGRTLYARYPGMSFDGVVWWADDEWHCEVWQHREHVATASSPSLHVIMAMVCDRFGDA